MSAYNRKQHWGFTKASTKVYSRGSNLVRLGVPLQTPTEVRAGVSDLLCLVANLFDFALSFSYTPQSFSLASIQFCSKSLD